MLLYRLGPEGFWAAGEDAGSLRVLFSDPFETPVAAWEFGKELDAATLRPLAPVTPRKIVGIGRNYREHAAELGNEMPAEPLIFLKATTTLIGPREPIVLPPESAEVHFEGEVALVIGTDSARASTDEARGGDLRLERRLRRHRPRPAEPRPHLRPRQVVRHLLPAGAGDPPRRPRPRGEVIDARRRRRAPARPRRARWRGGPSSSSSSCRASSPSSPATWWSPARPRASARCTTARRRGRGDRRRHAHQPGAGVERRLRRGAR